MTRRRYAVLAIFLACIASCGRQPSQEASTLLDIDITASPDGIVPLPEDVPLVFRNVFSKYTRIAAPNGKPIHMLAQAGWTNVQIKKARNVLQHILADFPGSAYGDDKSDVANAMSNRRATMVLFNTEEDLEAAMRGPLGDIIDLSMQDLRANECPAEGTEDYMNHITRDAAFEEIWHLVHDYGIKPRRPDMLAEMRKANDAAAKKGWTAWPDDEPQEHPNEYVGVLLDNYLDLWTVRPKKYEGRDIGPEDVPEGQSHFGRYFAGSREKLRTLDPEGYALVEKFFHPYLTYTPELPETFEGHFSIAFDESLVYTYKSQHLNNVTLTGNGNAGISGNDRDNVLIGNNGDNVLKGGAGDDQLIGGSGKDTALFSGKRSDYTITQENDTTTVIDREADRDGADTLRNVEILQFSDQTVELDVSSSWSESSRSDPYKQHRPSLRRRYSRVW
jgi:hypothetical protein